MGVEVLGGFSAIMQGYSVDAATLADEVDEEAGFGTVTWRTLISADRRPSAGIVAGLATFGGQGTLLPHRHSAPEFYFGLDGDGVVTIDGTEHRIAAGIAVYLPGGSEHGVVAGENGLKFVYAFPVDAFQQVDYRFSAAQAAVG